MMTSIHSRETIYCKKGGLSLNALYFIYFLTHSTPLFHNSLCLYWTRPPSCCCGGVWKLKITIIPRAFCQLSNGRDKLKSALWNCFFSWTTRKNKSLVCFSKKSFSQCVDWSRYLQIWISCQNQNSSLLVHSLIIFINDAYIIQNFI